MALLISVVMAKDAHQAQETLPNMLDTKAAQQASSHHRAINHYAIRRPTTQHQPVRR